MTRASNRKNKMHPVIIMLLLPLSTCIPLNGESPESLKSACHKMTVTEGNIARLEFPISKAVRGDPNMYMFIRNPDMPGDILDCDLNITTLKVECSVLKDQFKHELTDDTLSLIIPHATRDVKGRYELHAVHNGAADHPISCHLVVRNVPARTPKNNSDGVNVTHLIVIACVVIGVAVSLVSCVHLCNYVLRKLQQTYDYVLLTVSTGQSGVLGKHNKSEKETQNMSRISTEVNMSKTSYSKSCAMEDEESKEPLLGNSSERGTAENAPGGITTYDEQHAATNAEDRHVPPNTGHRSPTTSVGNQDGYTTSGKTSLTEDQNQSGPTSPARYEQHATTHAKDRPVPPNPGHRSPTTSAGNQDGYTTSRKTFLTDDQNQSHNQSGPTSPAREAQDAVNTPGGIPGYDEQHETTQVKDRHVPPNPGHRSTTTSVGNQDGYTTRWKTTLTEDQNKSQNQACPTSPAGRGSCDPSKRKSATPSDDSHGYTPLKSAAQNQFEDGSRGNSARETQYEKKSRGVRQPYNEQHAATHAEDRRSSCDPSKSKSATLANNPHGYTPQKSAAQNQFQDGSGANSARRSSYDPSKRKSATLADDPHGYTSPKSAAQNQFQDGSGANSARKSATLADDPHGYTSPKSAAQNQFQDGSGANYARNSHCDSGRVASSERSVDQHGSITRISSSQPAHQHHSDNQTSASSNRNASSGSGIKTSTTPANNRYGQITGMKLSEPAKQHQPYYQHGASSSQYDSRKSATPADDPHDYTPPKSAAQNQFEDGSGANSARNGYNGSGRVASSKPPVDHHVNITRIPSSQPVHQHHSHSQTSAWSNRNAWSGSGTKTSTTPANNRYGQITGMKSYDTAKQHRPHDQHGASSSQYDSRNGSSGSGKRTSAAPANNRFGQITGRKSSEPHNQHQPDNQYGSSSPPYHSRNASHGAGKRSSATAADPQYDYTARTKSLQTAMKYQSHKSSLV